MIRNAIITMREWVAELPPQTRVAWKWDILSGLFAGLYQGCIWTFVPKIARNDLHATGAQMAWISAAPAIGFIFSALWARQMDGKNKLPFCYWTWLIARGLYLLTPLVATREQFVALVCFTPLMFSISNPAYAAIMKDIYPDALRGRLMSLVRIVANLMTLSAALIVGRLLDHQVVNWQLVFAVGGALGVVTSFTFSRIPMLPPAPSDKDEPRVSTYAFLKDTFGILVRNPGYRWYTASVFVYGFGNLIAATLYPIYQVDRFHVSNTDVANMQNIGSILTILGFFFWGWFLDRKGPLATVLLAIGIICLTPLCYVLAWDLTLLYVAAAATGVAVSGIDLGYLNTTLLFAEEGKASQYQALHSSFFGIRGSIAPHFAVPLMMMLGAKGAFMVSLFIMVCGGGLQLISMRDYRRQAAEERLARSIARERVTG